MNDTTARPRRAKTAKARFLEKVALPDENGCMIWLGCTKPEGYGTFRGNHGKMTSAHRFSYEHFIAPVPPGLSIDHLCRVRNCVAPLHLESVTQRVNVLRGATIPAMHASKTHCVKGHRLSGENVRMRKARGWRVCVTCERVQERGRVRRKAA